MFEMMKKILGKHFFTTAKVIPSDFFQTMFDTMASSIKDSHIAMGFGEKPKEYNKVIQKAKKGLRKDMIIYETITDTPTKKFSAKCTISNNPAPPKNIDKNYWKNLNSKYHEIKIETEIEIETIPFAEGKISYAFRIKDHTRKRILVGKIDKSIWHREFTNDLESAQERTLS